MKFASPRNLAFCRPICQYHRPQVHVRTQSTKQATKSTAQSASRSCDGVNASRSRNLPAQHLRLRPMTLTHKPSILATAWVEAPVKHRPGARSHQLHGALAEPGGCNVNMSAGRPLRRSLHGILHILRTSLSADQCANIIDARCICPDPEHTASHKKHHTIQSASRSCDGVKTSQSQPFRRRSIYDPHTIRPRHCMGQSNCKTWTGCPITPTGAPSPSQAGAMSTYRREGPYRKEYFSGKRGFLQTNVPISSTPVHVRTKSTKQATKRHHTIQSASRSCDGVNASRSRIPPRSLVAASQ